MDGALATLTRGNGTTTAVQVDGIGRLARLTHDFAGTAQDWQASFSYTPSSQIASRSQVNDAVYAWRGHYNVNRSDTANGLNQLTTSGPLTLTYVNVSNLKSDGTWTYNYDTENKLRKVTRPGVVVQLNYDPFDRLFVTTATPGTLTKFLYDGDALIGEYDTNDQLQQRTVHGPGVDAPLVRYDAAGVRRWLHADERGSVVAESDASGLVVATCSYGPYGEPDSTAGGRLRYTGQMLIPELGLYHYRARTYSAYLGRFLQADPAGTADGLNLYAYVGNDPINATDPSGMFRLSGLFHSSFLPRFDSSSGGVCPGGQLDCPTVRGSRNLPGSGPSGGSRCPNGFLDCGGVTGNRDSFRLDDIIYGYSGGRRYINEQREMDDKQQQICNKPNEGGKGKTLRQRASIARAQAASNTAIGSIIGLITGGGKGAVVGGAAGYAITAAAYANGLRTGGSLVSGGGSQGNRAYGAVAAGLGIPLKIALRFAGFYEQYGAPSNGEYDAKNGTFLGAPPYGDDPGAQDAIREGYACAAN